MNSEELWSLAKELGCTVAKDDSGDYSLFYTKNQLKERGWTDKMISQLAGDHDKEKENPLFRGASAMKLYQRDRIEAIERGEAFKAALAKAEVRRVSSGRAVETKRKKTLETVEGWNPEILTRPLPVVTKEAISSFNYWKAEVEERTDKPSRYAKADSEPEFLRRITVNYLRHELSDYERRLNTLKKGAVGKREAYHLIREKVLNSIAEAYPSLREECERQKEPYVSPVIQRYSDLWS